MNPAAVSVGVQLPTTDGFGVGYRDLREVGREAEDAGLDSVWIGDHFSFTSPVVESMIAAATVAAATQHIRIGFGVLIAPLRHPGWLAKQISSLQVVSGNRVILGLGVGGEFPAEWEALGVSVTERKQRIETTLDALPNLLSGRPARLGAPFDTRVPPLTPHGDMPPLWVGGRQDAALARAIRHSAGWMGVWLDPPAMRSRVDQLRDIAADLQRPVPPVGAEILVHLTDAADQGRTYMSEFMQAIYGIPFERLERYCVGGNEDHVTARLAAMVAEGLDTVVLIPAVPDTTEALPALGRIAERLRALRPSAVDATRALSASGRTTRVRHG
jgi:alkanesulfonate monooxygenase SsuD/methylene tetrahydromethanopterin reductase-like flavin-dependent oxidoreductase (luciferase family)